ncbi:MAG: large-conductance mechanosensitive channel protein MscL [Bacteroidales bacterium]
MSKFIQEFKEFAIKGNVVDMAIGIIIGGAFGKIVSSVVADIIMPIIGIFMGGVNFTNLKYVIKDAIVDPAGVVTTPESAILYGKFLQTTLDFVIIAFAIFLMLKMIMKLKKEKVEEPAPSPEPTNEEKLLSEIRDLLKNKN